VTTRFLGKLNFKLKKIGKPTIFTAEKKALVWCRIAMNDFGFPVNNTNLQCNVKECLQSKGRTLAKFKKYYASYRLGSKHPEETSSTGYNVSKIAL
jgi:hypothetical protein